MNQELLNNLSDSIVAVVNELVDEITNVKEYKSWIGLVSQSGTNSPNAIQVFSNELVDGNWSFQRQSEGTYILNSPGSFSFELNVVSPQHQTLCKNNDNAQEYGLYITRIDSDNLLIETVLSGSNIHADDLLHGKFIELQIWPE